MKRFAPLALIAALTLTGCVSAEPSAESEPAPTVKSVSAPVKSPTPTTKPTPTKTVDKSQEWADDMINLMLNGNGKSKFKDFSTETTNHYIKSWSQPKPGVLAIEVENKKWSNCDLDSLGMNVLDTAGWDNPDLVQVVVSSEDGNLVRESLTNAENKNRDFAIPESCA